MSDREISERSPSGVTPADIRVLAIAEGFKTARLMIVTGGAVIGIGLICWASVKIFSAEQPLWVQVAAIAVSGISAVAAPSAVAYRAVVKFRAYISQHHGRTAALELEVNPSRESSGLSPDGRSPNDV